MGFYLFRNIANGEILGIHLLLEDILMLFNEADDEIFRESEPLKVNETENDDEELEVEELKDSEKKDIDEDNIVLVLHESLDPLKQFSLPLLNYAKIRCFLITWKRLEVLKMDWTRRKMLIENFNDGNLFSKFR
jgi:hypothetical protein